MPDRLIADLKYALRILRNNPGFSVIAILTLALGIGANTAIFTVVDHVVLRPLAYREADRLVAVHEIVPKFAQIAPMLPVNAVHFEQWRKSLRSFASMALLDGTMMNLTGSGTPERIPRARVSSNLFSVLGVRPQLGRLFYAEEDRDGRDREVILNNELWRNRFASDPNIVGRKILLDGNPFVIVGVLPPDFRFPKLNQLFAMTVSGQRPQIWKPFALRDEERDDMGDFNYACIARLRPGVTLSQASAELNVVQQQIAARFPQRIELRAAVVPLQQQITGRARTGLILILSAVAVVLLIGCVNIANLLLARATARRREMAIRVAIGASRATLVRQMLVESLTLSSIGGALGIAIAWAALKFILSRAPVDLPRLDEIQLDARILLFTSALVFIVAAAVGQASTPAAGLETGFWGFRPRPFAQKGAATADRRTNRTRSILIAVEVGLGALCLIAGGLLLHSFINLLHVDRGFDAEHVLTVNLNLPREHYNSLDKLAGFQRDLLDRVKSIPGVASAGVSNMLPLSGEGSNNGLLAEGEHLRLLERPITDMRFVNPDYFPTLGIPLLRGRLFSDGDRARHVAVISAQTAARVWPGQNAIGKRFRLGDDDSALNEIVGIAGDVRGVSLGKKPGLTVYLPYWQRSRFGLSLAVRTAAAPASVFPAITAAIRAVDPEMPVPPFHTMDDVVSESVAQRRFQMDLVLAFGIAALLLAALGIYGVVSYSVAQRTSEMGIRMALGAEPSSIRAMIVRQALTPVVAGLAAGIVLSLALGRLLAAFLFDTSPADPVTLAAVAATLIATAAVAGYAPARRATRVDPLVALRYE